jgi:hypothetical protein
MDLVAHYSEGNVRAWRYCQELLEFLKLSLRSDKRTN